MIGCIKEIMMIKLFVNDCGLGEFEIPEGTFRRSFKRAWGHLGLSDSFASLLSDNKLKWPYLCTDGTKAVPGFIRFLQIECVEIRPDGQFLILKLEIW